MTRMRHVITVAGILMLAGMAAAQVQQTQDGRSLDASYQVGAGRVNAPVGSGLNLNSQLYINGQVTGLGGFHGTVGYRAPNQIGTYLPSAGLSNFQRQSTGLADVLGGATADAGAIPYYDRSTTALGLQEINSGMAVPGSNVPLNSRITPNIAHELYVKAMANYTKIMPEAPGGTLWVPPDQPLGGASPGAADALGGSVTPPAMSGAYTVSPPAGAADTAVPVRPGTGALFGVPRTEDRRDLAKELYELGREQPTGPLDLRVEDATGGPNAVTEAGVPISGRTAESGRDLTGQTALGGRTDRVVVPAGNQDVFLDMLVQLGQGDGQAPAESRPPETQPDYLAGPAPVKVPEFPQEDKKAEPGAASRPAWATTLPEEARPEERQTPEQIVERAGGGLLLHGLAGRSKDRFNMYMTSAENKMRQGRYAEATMDYECALIIDGQNPLARMGMCLSLLAAGEPLRSAVHLRRAMELFPPLMETRIDVAAIMDDSVIERQVLLVDKRLDAATSKIEPLLALLSIYVHYNANEMVEAQRYARRLQAAAPEDKLYAAYAAFVLTGKRPGQAGGEGEK